MRFKFCLVLIAILFLNQSVSAATVVKMGTLVPQGSPWHDILREMADQWKSVSGGQLEIKIFAGGIAGDEPDMIRKLRIGQLHAAAITSVGLGSIDKATEALNIPLAFSSWEELDYVRDRISPKLEQLLADRGFVVLNWGDAGWVYFFVQKPSPRVADLKAAKLFTWAGDPAATDLLKDTGFHPVPLATTDVLPALQTGMINAFDTTAIFALSSQWFPFTKYMLEMKWAPLTGATIISKKTWDKIPADIQPKLLEASKQAGKQLRDNIRTKEKDAIDAMMKRGLHLVPVPPDAIKEWQELAISVYPRIRGQLVPADYFDEVLKLRDEYRKSKGETAK